MGQGVVLEENGENSVLGPAPLRVRRVGGIPDCLGEGEDHVHLEEKLAAVQEIL